MKTIRSITHLSLSILSVLALLGSMACRFDRDRSVGLDQSGADQASSDQPGSDGQKVENAAPPPAQKTGCALDVHKDDPLCRMVMVGARVSGDPITIGNKGVGLTTLMGFYQMAFDGEGRMKSFSAYLDAFPDKPRFEKHYGYNSLDGRLETETTHWDNDFSDQQFETTEDLTLIYFNANSTGKTGQSIDRRGYAVHPLETISEYFFRGPSWQWRIKKKSVFASPNIHYSEGEVTVMDSSGRPQAVALARYDGDFQSSPHKMLRGEKVDITYPDAETSVREYALSHCGNSSSTQCNPLIGTMDNHRIVRTTQSYEGLKLAKVEVETWGDGSQVVNTTAPAEHHIRCEASYDDSAKTEAKYLAPQFRELGFNGSEVLVALTCTDQDTQGVSTFTPEYQPLWKVTGQAEPGTN